MRMSSNTGKALLVIVLLGGAIGLFIFNMRGGEKLANVTPYVCISTGKVFMIRKDGTTRIPPIENPETKTMTLLPCLKESDGYYVSKRYLSALRGQELAALNKAVDPQTGKVQELK
jgi:hypothetical protein